MDLRRRTQPAAVHPLPRNTRARIRPELHQVSVAEREFAPGPTRPARGTRTAAQESRARQSREHVEGVPVGLHGGQFTTMRIPVETFHLDNGLFVTLSEDHTAPIVAVNLWYHVGSANEKPGRTGFAHLFGAHALSGFGACGIERTLRADPTSGWNVERIDLARANELLRDGSLKRARARAMAGSRSIG